VIGEIREYYKVSTGTFTLESDNMEQKIQRKHDHIEIDFMIIAALIMNLSWPEIPASDGLLCRSC
jgi:hypothetical protein